MTDAELIEETDHHDRARAAMQAMHTTTSGLMDTFEQDFAESRRNRRPGDARPDHNMGRAMANYGAHRLDDLTARDLPLFFGRLWLETGEDYHLGRRHVRDESDRAAPLVIDWRAPFAERFYRASTHLRQEVLRRRRYGFQGNTLTSFEDEDLRSGTDATSSFLQAEIARPRTGPMRDIVATIQPEQDELIRQGADISLVVQGAPGTGKTAVGLHRAAWLLYTFPARLSRSGMLVVGPNEGFLRHIAAVLPTLGESSVWQVTVDELTGAGDAPGTDDACVAAMKNDARMVDVCERAVWCHLHETDRDLDVVHNGLRLTMPARDVHAVLHRTRTTSRTWGSGRKAFVEGLAQELRREAESRTRQPRDHTWVAQLKRQPAFREVADASWPRLTARQVLKRLYTDDDFRALACTDVLQAGEQDSLQRRGGRPTPADHLLLDEIHSHLQSLDTAQTFGHIVVDEAQDLSPLQCRAIARRCRTGAITALGDLAQGTTPWAAADWAAQMRHLGHPEARVTALTTGYRVPAVILEIANRLLPQLAVDVAPARSMRSDGALEVLATDDLVAGAVDAAAKALVEEGVVGVIAGGTILDRLREALPDDERLELLSPSMAKGLEFDHVIVVEPADFVSPSPGYDDGENVTGWRHLYVALTRAVSRLTLVHARPLPTALGSLT